MTHEETPAVVHCVNEPAGRSSVLHERISQVVASYTSRPQLSTRTSRLSFRTLRSVSPNSNSLPGTVFFRSSPRTGSRGQCSRCSRLPLQARSEGRRPRRKGIFRSRLRAATPPDLEAGVWTACVAAYASIAAIVSFWYFAKSRCPAAFRLPSSAVESHRQVPSDPYIGARCLLRRQTP
jgi:hypothetical protein